MVGPTMEVLDYSSPIHPDNMKVLRVVFQSVTFPSFESESYEELDSWFLLSSTAHSTGLDIHRNLAAWSGYQWFFRIIHTCVTLDIYSRKKSWLATTYTQATSNQKLKQIVHYLVLMQDLQGRDLSWQTDELSFTCKSNL